MRGCLLAALAVLVTALPGFAADGLTPDAITGGNGQDWIDRGNGGEKISQLAVAFSYDIVLSEMGDYGMSFWQLISAAPGTDGANENDWITESSVGWWKTYFNAQLETMAAVSFVTWGANVTGEDEFLAGPLVALRAPVEWEDTDGDGFEDTPLVWMEVRGKYYMGQDGIRQVGLNVGPLFRIGS